MTDKDSLSDTSSYSFFLETIIAIAGVIILYLWMQEPEKKSKEIEVDNTNTQTTEITEKEPENKNSCTTSDESDQEKYSQENTKGENGFIIQNNNYNIVKLPTLDVGVQTDNDQTLVGGKEDIITWRGIIVNDDCNCNRRYRTELKINFDGTRHYKEEIETKI